MVRVVAAAMVVACGPGIAPQDPHDAVRATLVAASNDGQASAYLALMRESVTLAGLWFPDATCRANFPQPGVITPDRFDALAECLAKLHLKPSERRDSYVDVIVMTYEPGFEIEARVLDTDDGPRLTWIGFEARRNTADALPTVSPATLEALRAGGDLRASAATEPAWAWIKVCIDTSGAVTGAHLREVTSLSSGRAFANAVTTTWSFRPFVVDGQPLPVCAMWRLASDAKLAGRKETLPVIAPDETVVLIDGNELRKRRIAGTTQIAPSFRIQRALKKQGMLPRFIGGFTYCVDESGHVTSVTMLRSTGLAPYDRQLEAGIHGWVFAPYVEDGHPVPVCSAATFIYTQH